MALKNVEFTPSAFANLNVDAVFASYTELSWDDGDIGEDEEDGKADFRIVRRELPANTWGVAMDWTRNYN